MPRPYSKSLPIFGRTLPSLILKRNSSSTITSEKDDFLDWGHEHVKAIGLRILHKPDQADDGPTTIIIPHLPIRTFDLCKSTTGKIPYGEFGASFFGVLSYVDANEKNLIALNDAHTTLGNEYQKSIPMMRIGGASHLYKQFLDIKYLKTGEKLNTSFPHNETLFRNIKKDISYCVTDISRLEDIERMLYEKKIILGFDEMCYYHESDGKLFHMDKHGVPTEEVLLPRNVLSHKYVDSEMIKFEEREYWNSIANIVQTVRNDHGGKIPFSFYNKYEPENPVNFLMQDVEKYIENNPDLKVQNPFIANDPKSRTK